MRLGDLDALKDKLKINFSRKPEAQVIYQHLIDIIDDCPTVEQEIYMNGKDFNLYLEGYKQGKKDFERPQGEWVIDNWGLWHCNKCNQIKEQFSANYCCYCGADMRGEENAML